MSSCCQLAGNLEYIEGDVMAKDTPIHYDMLKKEITTGTYAVSFDNNSLKLFVVDKLNPIMVRLRVSKGSRTVQRYPQDLIVIDNDMVMLKMLSE
jgi:hypothetical protein